MKAVLVTYGSRGDVQPLMALGLALKAAGHEVLFAGPPEQARRVEGCGCPFSPLGANVEAFLEMAPDSHTFRAAIVFARFLRQEIQSQFAQLPAIIRGADVVLGASLIFAAPTVAESLGVPFRFIAFCPQALPSSQHPSMLVRNHNLPRWLNRFSWWFTNKCDIFHFKGIINRKRCFLGLKPVRNIWRHLLGSRVIVASDEILGHVPRDVEQDYVQTGYFHLHQTGGLSAGLERFLASGPPPVFAGFGSMSSEHPGETARMVLSACRSAGQRVILSPGWGKPGHMEAQQDCYVVGDTPHVPLFPRLAAVVHHGGSGTTATAARAGVPQIIIPHIFDQYYWANRIYRAGLGPQPISRSRMTSGRLCAAIRECVSDTTTRQRARQVAGIIKGCDSLGKAVTVVESD